MQHVSGSHVGESILATQTEASKFLNAYKMWSRVTGQVKLRTLFSFLSAVTAATVLSLIFMEAVSRHVKVLFTANRTAALHLASSLPSPQKRKFYHREVLNRTISCRKFFENDQKEINESLSIALENRLSANAISQMFRLFTEDCEIFARTRLYLLDTGTPLEASFPLAYSIMAYTNAEQVERLLRAIYRPQNVYCLHVDAKSVYEYKTLESVASCFKNVFMSSRRVYVGWNNFTSLEADLICMQDLLRMNRTWKYFINLTGQEFPLKTNLEIVKILRILNGANDVQGIAQRVNRNRWANAGPVPGNLTLVKGSNHVTLSRAAVDFIIHNPLSKALIEWHRNVSFPGESFFSILNHNPQAGMPGAYKGNLAKTLEAPIQRSNGEPSTVDGKPFLSRYKFWQGEAEYECKGKFVRMICVHGVGDLSRLDRRKELFVNKLYQDYQPAALVCLEELIYNRTREEYLGRAVFNTSYYENLEFYKNVVR